MSRRQPPAQPAVCKASIFGPPPHAMRPDVARMRSAVRRKASAVLAALSPDPIYPVVQRRTLVPDGGPMTDSSTTEALCFERTRLGRDRAKASLEHARAGPR